MTVKKLGLSAFVSLLVLSSPLMAADLPFDGLYGDINNAGKDSEAYFQGDIDGYSTTITIPSNGGIPPPVYNTNTIEFYSSTNTYVHYKAGDNGKHTQLYFRTNTTTPSQLSIIVENQNSDWAPRTIEFNSSSNQFVEKYTVQDPRVYFGYSDTQSRSFLGGPTYWSQTACVEGGKLKIKAEYKPLVCTSTTSQQTCTLGALQTATAWLAINTNTQSVTSSGIVTSANGKLKQGITVNTSTKQICFVTNLYTIYSFTRGGLIDGVLDSANTTKCMNYQFK